LQPWLCLFLGNEVKLLAVELMINQFETFIVEGCFEPISICNLIREHSQLEQSIAQHGKIISAVLNDPFMRP
jgi:hypothetical protein